MTTLRKTPCQSCRYHTKDGEGFQWECFGCGEWIIRYGKATRP